MRRRTTTTRETTAGRRELVEGAVKVVWGIRMKGGVKLIAVHSDTGTCKLAALPVDAVVSIISTVWRRKSCTISM